MTKDKLIKELESGLKNPNVPETFKDKIRVKLAALKAEEPKENKGKEKTTDVRSLIKYKNKFNVGDIVVSKKDNSTYKVDSFVKRNADFIYTLSNEIKNNVYHIEEEDLKIKTPAKNTLSNEDILAILYNADNKGYSATKADSGGTIRSSDELTEKYANAVSKNLTGIEKGSLSEEIYDELVDGNNHLLNEFLAWNGYYNSETSKSLKKMYQGIWERGNRQAADPEIITLGTGKDAQKQTFNKSDNEFSKKVFELYSQKKSKYLTFEEKQNIVNLIESNTKDLIYNPTDDKKLEEYLYDIFGDGEDFSESQVLKIQKELLELGYVVDIINLSTGPNTRMLDKEGNASWYIFNLRNKTRSTSDLKIGQKYKTKKGDILTIKDFDVENHVTTDDGKGNLSSQSITRISMFKELIKDGELILVSDKKLKATTATPIKKAHKKYIANREIKSVTILEDGKKLTYAGKDVLNGANFFKEGGVLTSKATYVPIRNIVEVIFEDGSKDKPRNGYHIRNGATPIMEHGGEVKEYAIKLVPLELEPLSSQLKSYTRDSLTSGDYTNESGKEYSTAPGEIIVHKASGRKFEIPEKIYDYVGGFNLVYDKNKNKIVTWEEGNLVAEVKDGKLDFANKDESIFIDKTKVESEFKKGFIPEKSNEKWAYIAIEGKLQNLYAISEDLEDDKTTNAWKNNQAKIEKFEDFLHRIERKYENGGSVELPEGSLQHFENYYLEKGGKLKTSPDLFENYDLQPKKLQKIVDYYQNLSEEDELDYENMAVFLKEVEAVGYTFDYGLSNEPYGLRPIGTELVEEEEYKLGGSLLSAWKRERKYVNKSQDYETRYAKGKNRKGYSKFAKGGPIPQKGDFAKVPVGYGMYHYGLIKGIIKDDPTYPQNGYEIVGIGDVLHPEQFKVISQSEFEKQKSTGTDVKTNSFLVIEKKFEKGGFVDWKSSNNQNKIVTGIFNVVSDDFNGEIELVGFERQDDINYSLYQPLYGDRVGPKEIHTILVNSKKINDIEKGKTIIALDKNGKKIKITRIGGKYSKTNLKYEKGGVLKVGDEVVDFDTMKHLGKVVEVYEINLDEDDIIVETPEGKTIKLNSFNVLRKPNVKANLGASPEVKLSIEELKAKHSVSNYGKGGKTDNEDPRGANFRLAKEIRQPGERWQDAVSRATKMLK